MKKSGFMALVFMVITLCPFQLIGQVSTFNSIVRNNVNSILFTSVYGRNGQIIYNRPVSVNDVSLEKNILKLNYNHNTVESNRETVSYSSVVSIDLTKTMLNFCENNHTGLFDCGYDYYVDFVSLSKISELETCNKNHRKTGKELKTFRVFCATKRLAMSLIDCLIVVIQESYPQYEMSNQGVKDCFSHIQNLIKANNLQSSSVYFESLGKLDDFVETKNVSLTYKDGNLIIKYLDKYCTGCSGGRFNPGSKTITVPIQNSTFSFNWMGGMTIYVPDGMKYSCGKENTIITSESFYANSFVVEDLTKHLIVLQNLIKKSGFKGTLGGQNTQQKSNTKINENPSKKISNKYEQ